MASHDDIGGRGEAIFCVRITAFCGRKQPFFRPRFLGKKAATVDYLVELLGAGERTPYFFVQVKTTRLGYTRRGNPPKLKVALSGAEVRSLALYPAPTYLVGIDEEREVGYIAAVLTGMRRPISSLVTNHRLDCHNLRVLWEEVKSFWEERDMVMEHSAFTIAGGR